MAIKEIDNNNEFLNYDETGGGNSGGGNSGGGNSGGGNSSGGKKN